VRRGEEAAEEDDGALAPAAHATSPDAFIDWDLARTVLARFDEDTQAVAVGVYVDGMNHDEVAEALGISRRTVSRRLERFVEGARKFLGVDGLLPATPAKGWDGASAQGAAFGRGQT
jgi:RNA polymerase sigma-70 factor (ECF subfamily)